LIGTSSSGAHGAAQNANGFTALNQNTFRLVTTVTGRAAGERHVALTERGLWLASRSRGDFPDLTGRAPADVRQHPSKS
jgi:hypothetical protein